MTRVQEWQDLCLSFARPRWRCTSIDPGVLEVVVALNALGLQTTGSSEGHLDAWRAYPWIRFRPVGVSAPPRRRPAVVGSGRMPQPMTSQLLHLLEVFYQQHPLVYDRHLVLLPLPCEETLTNHGAHEQARREPRERRRKLHEYRQEMADFATFLKQQFLTA